MNVERWNGRIAVGMMRYLSTLAQLKVMMFTMSLLKLRTTLSFIFLWWKESFDEYMPEMVKDNAQWRREISALSHDSNVQTTFEFPAMVCMYTILNSLWKLLSSWKQVHASWNRFIYSSYTILKTSEKFWVLGNIESFRHFRCQHSPSVL